MSKYLPPQAQYTDRAYLRLDDNTSAYPAPIDWNAIDLDSIAKNIHHYPQQDHATLRDTIAELYGVARENILCGAGSTEVLRLLILHFAKAKRILTIHPTFQLYAQFAEEVNARITALSVTTNCDIDHERWKVAQRSADMQLICNPNNPTGRRESPAGISELLDRYNGVTILDQTYEEFAETEGHERLKIPEMIEKYRIFFTRSFKAYGAANLRVGYAIGPRSDVENIAKTVQPPFALSDLQQQIACQILRNQEAIQVSARKILHERERVFAELQKLGYDVISGTANFLLFRPHTLGATDLHRTLREDHGVLIRQFSNQRRKESDALPIEQMLRVTIGTPEQNDQFLAAMKTITAEK